MPWCKQGITSWCKLKSSGVEIGLKVERMRKNGTNQGKTVEFIDTSACLSISVERLGGIIDSEYGGRYRLPYSHSMMPP